MDRQSFNDAKLRATHEVLVRAVDSVDGDLRLVDPFKVADLVNKTFSYLVDPPKDKPSE